MIKVLVNKKGTGEELKWQELSYDEIVSMASTPALFGGSKTYILSGALVLLVDLLDALAHSPHTFVFEEEKLLKAELVKLEKVGAKIEKPAQGGSASGRKEWAFDQYGVAEALGKRDRKKLWLGLMQSFRAGEKAEAVAGLLCWKARAMKDAHLSRQLTWMYHDAHRGAGDLELLLERFALKL